MDSPDDDGDEPCIRFVEPALSAFDKQSIANRGDLIVLARQIAYEPEVDGVSKFPIESGRTIYYDVLRFMVYEPDPDRLGCWRVVDFGPQ